MLKIHLKYWLLVVAIVWKTGSCNKSSENTNATNDFYEKHLLETSNFYINLNCIKQYHIFEKLLADNAENCSNLYKAYGKQCDIIFWNKARSCSCLNYSSLDKCPLTAIHGKQDIIVFFHISLKTPSFVKKQLIDNGYRNHLKDMLACNNSNFLCNNFKCISQEFRCDGIAQCLDNSDEILCHDDKKCYGRNGKYYSVGKEYVPNSELDQCKACICGSNGLPSHCFAPLCGIRLYCNKQSTSICCQCFGSQYSNSDFEKYSRRLLLSCLSVIFLVSMFLIFSRSFLKQSIRHRSIGGVQSSWFAMYDRNGRHARTRTARSMFDRNRVVHHNVDFFHQNILPIDVPPPYNAVKRPASEPDEERMGPPPSYDVNTTKPDQISIHVDGSASIENRATLGGEREPPAEQTSPSSATSQLQLLRVDSNDRPNPE